MLNRNTTLILTLAIVALLQSCGHKNVVSTQHDEVIAVLPSAEARMVTEARIAIEHGTSKETFEKFRELYKNRKSGDDSTVLNYAQLLKNNGKVDEAAGVLSKYALNGDAPNTKVSPALINELAADEIERGNFRKALELTNKVLSNNSATGFHSDAHDLAGVALDSLGKHVQAEVELRLALEGWKGETSKVKNNLAACLASQGKFDEALLYLRQALVEAPHKEEIAKNIELISSIRDSITPKPKKK